MLKWPPRYASVCVRVCVCVRLKEHWDFVISAYGSTESLSSQWKEERKKGEEGSDDKDELKAEWRAGVEEIDKERVGEW